LIGSVLAPLLVIVADSLNFQPLVVMGLFASLSLGTYWICEETYGKPLKE
jgi:hypothetical protein